MLDFSEVMTVDGLFWFPPGTTLHSIPLINHGDKFVVDVYYVKLLKLQGLWKTKQHKTKLESY